MRASVDDDRHPVFGRYAKVYVSQIEAEMGFAKLLKTG